jgi:hypothetical protein
MNAMAPNQALKQTAGHDSGFGLKAPGAPPLPSLVVRRLKLAADQAVIAGRTQ